MKNFIIVHIEVVWGGNARVMSNRLIFAPAVVIRKSEAAFAAYMSSSLRGVNVWGYA